MNGTLPSHECEHLDSANLLDGRGQLEDRSTNVPQNLLQMAISCSSVTHPPVPRLYAYSYPPASNLFLLPLLLLLRPTCDPNCDDQNHKDDDTELPKLRPSNPLQNGDILQREEPKPVADDVPSLSHPAVPGITHIELICGGDVQKQVPQGRLQRIERKIEQVERYDCETDGGVGNVSGSFWIPIALSPTEQVDEERGELFAIGEDQGGYDEHGGGRDDPVSTAVFGGGRIRDGAYCVIIE